MIFFWWFLKHYEILPFAIHLSKYKYFVTIRENCIGYTYLFSIHSSTQRQAIHFVKAFWILFLKAFLKGSDISSSSFCHLRSKKAFELSWQIFENLDFRLSKSDRCAEIWVVKVASNLLLQISLCNFVNYMKLQVGRMYPIQRYKECIQFDSKICLNWVQKSVSIV